MSPQESDCSSCVLPPQKANYDESKESKGSEGPKGSRWIGAVKTVTRTVVHFIGKQAGVGLVCSVAYFDPGNWGVDLQAGSQYGYRLLFVVLLAGLIAVFLQVLASRLGCVTGLDLASHCRLLLHSHPTHPKLTRWLLLYPLYVLSEISIIATDLAELLGSAMALSMLFPSLQLWHGVLITAFDVIFLLMLKDPLGGRPVRLFELGIAVLVLAVLICMCIIISRVDVNWGQAFQGYLPSKYIFPNGALYTSVGIIGATVMPHSLFLGSALATQVRDPQVPQVPQLSKDPIASGVAPSSSPSIPRSHSPSLSLQSTPSPSPNPKEPPFPRKPTPTPRALYTRFLSALTPVWSSLLEAFRTPTQDARYTDTDTDTGDATNSMEPREPKSHSDWCNRDYDVIKGQLYHGIVDVAGSLLGIAVVINSLILILASAVFFSGNPNSENGQTPAGLFDAYDLIRETIGQSAATLFAIALLAAGQSSSIIATIAGQAVSEGFLRWRVSPVLRRLFTRLLAIIPSMAVAISLGRPGIDTLLVVSQVVLSVVLPFIAFPLVWLTSGKRVMSVRRVRSLVAIPIMSLDGAGGGAVGGVPGGVQGVLGNSSEPVVLPSDTERGASSLQTELVDFSNSIFTTLLAAAIWLVILAANVYVLVALGLGEGA